MKNILIDLHRIWIEDTKKGAVNIFYGDIIYPSRYRILFRSIKSGIKLLLGYGLKKE